MYEYRAVVVSNHDGDTITLDVDQGFNEWHHKAHIRLLRIDAPELKVGAAAFAARDYLTSICPPGSFVLLQSVKPDKYGDRWDGEVWRGLWDGDTLLSPENVSDLMMQAGHAVPRLYKGPLNG
jgi:endonuclease YncB( thermonuclease family)